MIRTYKSGRVRLTGNELTVLRHDCWYRDRHRCLECGRLTYWDTNWTGDPDRYHMAHIQSRGAGGSDTLENVRTLCGECHRKEHQGKL